jgi:hypothetical protein
VSSRPLRALAVQAALWLPLAFVVWFALGPLLLRPALWLARPVLLGHWGALFSSLTLGGDVLDAGGRVVGHAAYLVQLGTTVQVTIPPGPGGAGGVGVLEPVLNPMVYGYALPLFAGLAFATPLATRRRWGQIALAFAVIWLCQAFGIVAESLKTLAFDSGPEGAAAIARSGPGAAAIAIAYQFGYLILPAVAPVALWIGLNRDFVDGLVRQRPEPRA